MKILIDESLDVGLKNHFKGYEVSTVRDMNWLSKKNGELLKLSQEKNFDIFLTADKNLKHQQNISKLQISVIAFNTSYSELSLHISLIPKIIEIINKIRSKDSSEKYFEVEE